MVLMIIVMVIVTLLVTIGVIAGVFLSYKIRPAKCANNYLVKDSVKYRQKSDTYIRTRTSKVRIKSNK
jgi:uncharacterized protein YxeA